MGGSTELFLLIGSILLFISLIVGKTGSRFGVPTLLLFLFIGLLAGSDGYGIEFDSPQIAQTIGIIALNIILFSGGLDTRYSDINPILKQGITLATLGVLLTALITGSFVYWISNSFFTACSFSLVESLLLGSIMASTDSASVFGILRSRNISLKENLRPLLELESGSNDPMAYLLTIVLLQVLQSPEISTGAIVSVFLKQFIFGALFGLVLGKLFVRVINKINLPNDALSSVLLLAVMFFIFGLTTYVGGNGYLAVYLGGLVLGNHKFVHKRNSLKMFEGLTWLFQIIMFLSLGLLVNAKELIPLAGISILIALFMMLLSRPISVFICLSPFRSLSMRARHFTAWVGLRGAVPIIFATYPWIAGVPMAKVIFHIVFFVTILSLAIQGTTLAFVAHVLNLDEPTPEKHKLEAFDVEFADDIKSIMAEIVVAEDMLSDGDTLVELPIPDKALIAMVKRGDKYFVPRGKTNLKPDDTILVIADCEDTIKDTYQQLGAKML